MKTNKSVLKINEYQLRQIINESIRNILNESFNDKNISQAIEEHGGIDKRYKRWGAQMRADYDLQNSEYAGYLDSGTLELLQNADLLYSIDDRLIGTNDGGAVVVKPSFNIEDYKSDKRTPWEQKVATRNQNWGEQSSDRDLFINGFKREQYKKPNHVNTYKRRIDRFENK